MTLTVEFEYEALRPRAVVRSFFACALMATGLIDRGYFGFSRLRSKLVLEYGSEKFFDTYNALLYARKRSRDWATQGLAPFEEQAISSFFPLPPCTVLIGGAGAGREAFALARRGYQVAAFDPVQHLVASLAESCGKLPIESFIGRYEDLPFVRSLSTPPATFDLRSCGPFSAAILGPWSISHLRSDQQCIAALGQFRELTPGPILVSYPPFAGEPKRRFAMNAGLFRTFTSAEIRGLAEGAGLDVLYANDENRLHWYAILRRKESG